MIITFNSTAFRSAFPLFADSTTYPDAMLQGYWDSAVLYINPNSFGRMSLAARTRAINLMTAHIATLSDMQNNGEYTDKGQGQIIRSKIPGMEFTLVPPPDGDHFEWWCGLTAYGTQLLALLSVAAVGGILVMGQGIPFGPLR